MNSQMLVFTQSSTFSLVTAPSIDALVTLQISVAQAQAMMHIKYDQNPKMQMLTWWTHFLVNQQPRKMTVCLGFCSGNKVVMWAKIEGSCLRFLTVYNSKSNELIKKDNSDTETLNICKATDYIPVKINQSNSWLNVLFTQFSLK